MTTTPFDTCALCPRLCRVACPVATHSAREAAVPSVIAEVLRAHLQGRVSRELAAEAATLCVDCDACHEHCHLGVPLSQAIRTLRHEVAPLGPLPALPSVEGSARLVAIQTDSRAWSEALSARIGEPVATMLAPKALAVAWRDCPDWSVRLQALRACLDGRVPVVSHGGAAQVLAAAEIEYRWVHEVAGLTDLALNVGCRVDGCKTSPCCGGGGSLAPHHPEDAARMTARWHEAVAGRAVVDTGCSEFSRASGYAVTDVVGLLLAEG